MIIANAKYYKNLEGKNSTISVDIDNQSMFVPLDPANRHYQAIQEWVAEGNTIEEAD